MVASPSSKPSETKYCPLFVGENPAEALSPELYVSVTTGFPLSSYTSTEIFLALRVGGGRKPILISGVKIYRHQRAFLRLDHARPMTVAQLEALVGKGAREIEHQFVGLDFFVRLGAERGPSGEDRQPKKNRDSGSSFRLRLVLNFFH